MIPTVPPPPGGWPSTGCWVGEILHATPVDEPERLYGRAIYCHRTQTWTWKMFSHPSVTKSEQPSKVLEDPQQHTQQQQQHTPQQQQQKEEEEEEQQEGEQKQQQQLERPPPSCGWLTGSVKETKKNNKADGQQPRHQVLSVRLGCSKATKAYAKWTTITSDRGRQSRKGWLVKESISSR